MQTSYAIYTKGLLKKFLIQGSKRVPYSGMKKGSLLKDQREFLLKRAPKKVPHSRIKKGSLFRDEKRFLTQRSKRVPTQKGS